MDIPGVKAEHDTTRRRGQRGRFRADRPAAAERPEISSERAGCRVRCRRIAHYWLRRRETLRPPISHVRLRRQIRRHGRSRLRAASGNVRRGAGQGVGVSRFRQQLAKLLFGFRVVPFACVLISNVPARIDQILGRPLLVVERPPDAVLVVERHGVSHVKVAYSARDVGGVAFERELG